MIVLTLTRPWLLVGYRALGRERASGGLVRGIGEAVTQASAGAAFGRPGRTDGRGSDRRTWGRPEGPPHTRHRSQVAGEARLSSYLTYRSPTDS